MLIRNTTKANLEAALEATNRIFENNIRFRRLDRMNRGTETEGHGCPVFTYRVTLTYVKGRLSKGGHLAPGVRRGGWSYFHGGRVVGACWHVHGHFFRNLNPEAVIIARGNRLTPSSPWGDWNAGPPIQPVNMSDLCECWTLAQVNPIDHSRD